MVLACSGRPDGKDDLRPPRRAVKRPRLVMRLFTADLVARGALSAYLAWLTLGNDCDGESEPLNVCLRGLVAEPLVIGIEVEMLLSAIFVLRWCRWEAQGHLVTLWQVLAALEAFLIRRTIYASPTHYALILALLLLAYFAGMITEYLKTDPVRLPPFPHKAADMEKPRYGWLGPWWAQKCRNRMGRLLIAFILWASYQSRIILIAYYGTLGPADDIGDLPRKDVDMLILIGIFVSLIALVPNALVVLVTLPELFKDLCEGKTASKAYRTSPYEVALLDDDARPDSTYQKRLAQHLGANGGKCLSCTVVIPCYMPNEEEILMDVIDFYQKQEKEYPGEMKVMIVWNSPREHPEFEAQLEKVKAQWPALSVHRNHWSTSKCDNLNMAIELLRTDIALLNDADTMVSGQTMARASMHLCEEGGFDIAQSHSTHCWEDKCGQPEGGCFCFMPFITLFDTTKPLNMATQGFWKHSPFNGRGGFWRVSALQKVGFDHRIIGEDHDAGYRGCICFGMKGIIDYNMVCQEREPPDCKSFTSQRIRWETAALEMRRTFPWILRSPHYTKLEAFVLIWSQVCWNCNMPLQQAPFQMTQLLMLAVVKSYFWDHVWGPFTTAQKCDGEDCLATDVAVLGWSWAMPLLLCVSLGIFAAYIALNLLDMCIRLATTRYRPRIFYLLFGIFVVPTVMIPYLTYMQFWAIFDYSWGGAKFIVTTRSPNASPRNRSLNDLAEAGEETEGTGQLNTKGLGAPLLKG